MDIKIEFRVDWEPIYLEDKKAYSFPERISPMMRRKYKKPVIYRWNFFKVLPDDQKLIYIGETEELCPQRLNGFLNPGPSQQTNIRMNRLLKKYCEQGFQNRLEILAFTNLFLNEFILTERDLNDKHARKLLEELMIIIHRKKDYSILNL